MEKSDIRIFVLIPVQGKKNTLEISYETKV